MAQVVECLLCQCKTLSSNPSITKKKKRKEKKENESITHFKVF
jgi:hypothetical protein